MDSTMDSIPETGPLPTPRRRLAPQRATSPLQPPADAVQPFASGAARRWRRRCPETCPVAVRECPSTGSFVALPRTAANVHDSSDSHTSATPADSERAETFTPPSTVDRVWRADLPNVQNI